MRSLRAEKTSHGVRGEHGGENNFFYLFRVKRKLGVIRKIFKQQPHGLREICVLREMNLRTIVLFSFLFFYSSFVFSASLEELVGIERASVLRATVEPVTAVQQKAPSPRLLPQHGELRRFVAENQNSLEPNLFVETISVHHKPHTAEWSEIEQTMLFNKLTALSTFAGIQYYSESRKTMRTFYETSQIIDNPANRNPQPDPVFSVLPDSLILFVRQKDLTLGDVVYSFSYNTGKDYIFSVQENLTAMNAGIIPVAGKNKFRSLVAVIDLKDYLLIYSVAMAKASSVPGMGDRIGASFINRAKAILKWFSIRIDGVFK